MVPCGVIEPIASVLRAHCPVFADMVTCLAHTSWLRRVSGLNPSAASGDLMRGLKLQGDKFDLLMVP